MLHQLELSRRHLRQLVTLKLQSASERLRQQRRRLVDLRPSQLLNHQRQRLEQQKQLLRALSPHHLLERGFTLLRGAKGGLIRSVHELTPGERISVELQDGTLEARIERLQPCSGGHGHGTAAETAASDA